VGDGLAAATSYHERALPKVAGLVVFWAFFVADYFGAKATHGKKTCSGSYLAWQFGLLAAVLLAALAGSWLARASARRRTPVPGDIAWSSPGQLFAAVALAFGIGIIAGLLGLGGGELMAPLLLALGMLPQVGSATSAFMILFTSSSNLVNYLVEGLLTPEKGYVCWAVTLGFTSAMLGRLASIYVIKRLNHPSLIVFSLGILLVIAMSLLIARSVQSPPNWTFLALCE